MLIQNSASNAKEVVCNAEEGISLQQMHQHTDPGSSKAVWMPSRTRDGIWQHAHQNVSAHGSIHAGILSGCAPARTQSPCMTLSIGSVLGLSIGSGLGLSIGLTLGLSIGFGLGLLIGLPISHIPSHYINPNPKPKKKKKKIKTHKTQTISS